MIKKDNKVTEDFRSSRIGLPSQRPSKKDEQSKVAEEIRSSSIGLPSQRPAERKEGSRDAEEFRSSRIGLPSQRRERPTNARTTEPKPGIFFIMF